VYSEERKDISEATDLQKSVLRQALGSARTSNQDPSSYTHQSAQISLTQSQQVLSSSTCISKIQRQDVKVNVHN